jgi:hypothetical protein
MVGDNHGNQPSTPTMNIGNNVTENSGPRLNPALTPSKPMSDSVTSTSAVVPAVGDSVPESTQSKPSSNITSSVHLFFSGDSGEQGQRALSITKTTSVNDNNSKDGNDCDSSEVNKGAVISFFI